MTSKDMTLVKTLAEKAYQDELTREVLRLDVDTFGDKDESYEIKLTAIGKSSIAVDSLLDEIQDYNDDNKNGRLSLRQFNVHAELNCLNQLTLAIF